MLDYETLSIEELAMKLLKLEKELEEKLRNKPEQPLLLQVPARREQRIKYLEFLGLDNDPKFKSYIEKLKISKTEY